MAKLHDAALESDLAYKLTRARNALGISQAKLSARLAVSHVSIFNWETGRCFPASFRLWQEWAKVLRCNIRIEIDRK